MLKMLYKDTVNMYTKGIYKYNNEVDRELLIIANLSYRFLITSTN